MYTDMHPALYLSMKAAMDMKMVAIMAMYDFEMDENLDGSYTLSYNDFSTGNRVYHECCDDQALYRIMRKKIDVNVNP